MKTVTLYPTLENVMDSFFNDFRGLRSAPASYTLPKSFGFPSIDLKETENAYIMEAELPGYDEKNIQVHVDNKRLTIESAAEEEKEEKSEGKYLIKERRSHSFSRVFQLPESADSDAVRAVFKNGVLTLDIKKRPESQKRLIQING